MSEEAPPILAPPILAPVSFGELLDKISILELKEAAIHAEPARGFVLAELAALRDILAGLDLASRPGLAAAMAEDSAHLAEVNRTLWQVEDALRAHEARQDFGPGFIALARSVYTTNDERARLKARLNHRFGSRVVEVKSYGPQAKMDQAQGAQE